MRPSSWITTFVLGGIGGMLCDQIHVQSGVLWYPKPVFWDQAWWVAPLFGAATIVILSGSKPFARGSIVRTPSSLDLIVGFALFVAAYLSTGFFHESPGLLTAGLFITYLPRLFSRQDRSILALHTIVLAIGGTLFETILSSTGAFTYSEPHLGWVPMWLPLLYAHGSPIALDLTKKIEGAR